ncbi:MAG: hypothetical protein ABIQ53_07575, partial [Terracoccus sp.]
MPHATPRPAPPTDLSSSGVLALQQMSCYPSVSLLLTTTPGPRLSSTDAATLDQLAAEARARLAQEEQQPAPELFHAVDSLVDLARRTPVRQALALFASEDYWTRIDLDVPVENRCVIDPTFATRDLVRSLHRTPSHIVLLLSAHQATLLHGCGRWLEPAGGPAFPVRRDESSRRHRAKSGTAFLKAVDQALGAHLRAHPSPWVIIGAEPAVAQFRRMTQNTTRLAGVVTGNHLNAPLSDVADLTGPVITSYLRSRQDEALALLEQRTGQDRALYGIDTAWLAARWERPEMLIVEEGFFYPARVSADGDGLVPAADADHPDVLDDAVDELIETVLLRGGWVALAA